MAPARNRRARRDPVDPSHAPQMRTHHRGPLLGIDCVIPAAGLSSRLPEGKLTREFRGSPLIVHAVGNALAACERAIVVVGHSGEEVRIALAPLCGKEPRRVVFVENPHYRRGMITSIAQGSMAVRTDRFFVAPGDMPFLRPALYRKIAAADTNGPGPPLAGDDDGARAERPVGWFPTYRGDPGHPTLIRAIVRDALQAYVRGAIKEECGPTELPSMRRFLAKYPTDTVDVQHEGATIDIDTPEQFERYGRTGNGDPR